MLLFQSPLPPFSACSADGNSQGFNVQITVAAKIGRGDEARYQIGEECRYDDDNRVEGDWLPVGCTGTYRAIAVTQHGVLLGDIFFVRKQKKPSGGAKKPNNFDDKD